ncbi:hypothetical protein EPYR_02485 [Erwinia pyrifoliae DSM 12163]|nr:hypothetical protein EPYR_02485 [Erwinia pyrifoliae DSM 12163]
MEQALSSRATGITAAKGGYFMVISLLLSAGVLYH